MKVLIALAAVLALIMLTYGAWAWRMRVKMRSMPYRIAKGPPESK